MYTDPKNKKYFKAGGPGENRKDTRPASRAGEDKPRRDSRGPSQDSKVDTRPVNRGSDSRGFSQEKRDDTRPVNRGSQVRPRREAFTPSRDEDKGGREPASEQAADKERIPSDDRLEGRNPVLEALRAGRTINKLWVVKPEGGRIDPTMARIVTMARDKGVYYTEVPRITLDQMSETHNHQGVIAQCASHDYMEIEEIIRLAAEKGEVTAEVTSAVKLTAEQVAKLTASLKAKVGKTVKLNATVDESLIGGLIVKLGSTMIDTSVKSKLASLQNAMKEVG